MLIRGVYLEELPSPHPSRGNEFFLNKHEKAIFFLLVHNKYWLIFLLKPVIFSNSANKTLKGGNDFSRKIYTTDVNLV